MTDKPSPRRQEWLRQRQRSRRRVRLWQAGLLAALLGLWQLTTAVGLSDGFLISSPSRMWGTLVGLCRGGELLRHVGVSCLETVVGFLAGTLLGTAIAICMWWREGVARVLSPYLVVLNALPKTALGPIFIVWMGAGMGSIIVMTLAISLIVTILSTLSTTGFICLGVVLLTVAFRKKGGKMARSIKMAAFIGLVLLFVIESVTGVVENKIIGRNSGGSFYTRWNDTFSGFEIGLESPIAGQGVFSERKAEIRLEHRVQNISNGFAAFVMDTGLILPAVWLWLTYRGIRTKFAKARLLYVLGVFLLYFLCINTEGVFLNILFLGLLGKWQPDAEDTPDQQANARSQKKRRWRCTVPPEKLRLTFNTQPEDAAQEQTGETGGEES